MRENLDKLDSTFNDRKSHLDKLQGWNNDERNVTADDIRNEELHVEELKNDLIILREKLDAALDRNSKLTVSRQACSISLSKLREKENEVEKLNEEKNRITRQIEEKEASRRSQNKGGKVDRIDKKKYSGQVREKIEKYKKMREELSAHRAELVILQRTEQILKGKHKNLDDFVAELEKKKGIQVKWKLTIIHYIKSSLFHPFS